jgi:hypothetical protein
VYQRHTGKTLPKPDDVRTSFGELYSLPLEDWPPEYVNYALGDPRATLEAWEGQAREAQDTPGILDDEARQVRAAFALHLCEVWGIRTDADGIEIMRAAAQAEKDTHAETLRRAGLLRENGTRDLKAATVRMREVFPNGPDTDKGGVKMDEAACLASGDVVMLAWSRFVKANNVLTRDVKALSEGTERPIHTRFDTLLETSRTSSASPNIQNVRREGGARECFVPRAGHVFAACDYDKAELHALAEICMSLFGHSSLADELNAGIDPHLSGAAHMLGIAYEEAIRRKHEPEIKHARQVQKAVNFGLPGGLGAEKFAAYAKASYGVDMTLDEAKAAKEVYLGAHPEMRQYFAWVNQLLHGDDQATVRQHRSNRLRGGCSYTAACNTGFQGLCADFAKEAMYEVAKRCYAEPGNPLFGCRPTNFIHDEILLEVSEDPDLADAAARELQRVMVEVGRAWTPHCPVNASVSLMRRWSKNAEPVERDGKLICWEDA